ncbi:MAG TPA: arsenite S-adenosylmethyltransferase [Dehalococcoidia bacterium]|nr:arsenite S-adenosylmethyltransferase [Chloroflexota bacterium]MQF95053.1 arsenite methyltransferase [SAR202 cluster bacterium]HAA95063.1 arsenite S-adenosylmethyltransferase [Dehalococcoidia bacterium]HCL26543.1 arsenite S-adenosylmethyltransferase [Dehalococcoidia bacterium]|tara:strand:+ start:3433 stop:4215 length:783 start_codon:yes stop_codon:yes gene_type:complete
MATEQEKIKELVRERYGARAERVISLTPAEADTTGACCGADDTDHAMILYNEGQLAGLPVESIAASAGCGNPTALADLKAGERVLDLGSGGGIDCFLAAQQVGDTGHVTGLDMTPAMLELARANKEKLGIENVDFVKGEMEKMPIPDTSMDVIISNCVVCLSPDKDAVFSESFRVLAPGGRIHLSDVMALTEDGPSVSSPEDWVSCTAGAEHVDIYRGRLERAGFVDIEFTSETVDYKEAHPERPPTNTAGYKVVAHKPA